MEHIEEAGIHSGDSACALPPITRAVEYIAEIRRSTEAIARGVGVRGLLNVPVRAGGGVLYVLEANPRASRTVPFVSKATAVPLAKAAARIMLGATVAGLRGEGLLPPSGDGGTLPWDAPIAVKEAVLPFGRFRTPPARASTPCSGRRCARPARSWAWTRCSAPRSRSPRRPRTVAAGQGPRVRLGGRQGQALDGVPGQAPGRPGLPDLGDGGHREVLRATGSVPRSCASMATARGRTASRRSWSGSWPARWTSS